MRGWARRLVRGLAHDEYARLLPVNASLNHREDEHPVASFAAGETGLHERRGQKHARRPATHQ
jgi:hypothetical protein